jgi:hypothetical protein
LLALILIFSAGIRAALVLRGGEFYFPDENRYLRSTVLLGALEGLHPIEALRLVVQFPEHAGFVVLALPAALAQDIFLFFSPVNAYSLKNTAWIPALLLSISSVATIALLYAISRRLGGGSGEAVLAAWLGAVSACLAYFSRHLLPYDTSLAIALLALWVGLKRDPRPGRSLSCGALAGAAFLTYNGYWLVSAAVILIHSLLRVRSAGEAFHRWAFAGLGLVAPFGLLLAASALFGNLPAHLLQFASAVNQGDFSEGWSLPWRYLAESERGLLALWVVGLLLTVALLLRHGRKQSGGGMAAAGAVVFLYLFLALVSNPLRIFVVYGRSVRQIVPFFCLLTAYALVEVSRGWPRRAVQAGMALLVTGTLAQFLWNMRVPFAVEYPLQAERRAARLVGLFDRGTNFEGPRWRKSASGGARPRRYLLLDAAYPYGVTGFGPLPAGEVVFAVPHAAQFRPYGFEGFTPAERRLLAGTEIQISLIDREPVPR